MRGTPMIDSALVLFAYVSKHPDEPQSFKGLSKRTGIARSTLQLMVKEVEEGARRRGGIPILEITSYKFGFDFDLFVEDRIIVATYTGYKYHYQNS